MLNVKCVIDCRGKASRRIVAAVRGESELLLLATAANIAGTATRIATAPRQGSGILSFVCATVASNRRSD